MTKNSDQCLYCGMSRGELRVQKRANNITMPCITLSKRHRFTEPKRREKPPVPENQLNFDLAYEDM